MPSDRLKGSRDKAAAPFGFATGGPKGWRGPQTDHKAWSTSGMTDRHAGDTRRNWASVEKHQGGRSSPGHRSFATPHGTHGPDGAVNYPRWSVRNPTGKSVSEPPRKKRTKTISSR